VEPNADLPHIAVGLIVAEDGRVLLQHRDDKPGILEPGAWALFGGHMDPDEDPADAFLREMEEELGWKPKHFEPFDTVDLVLPQARLISHVFAAHLDLPLASLALNEGQGMALFPPDTLPSGIATDLPDLLARFAASDVYRRVRKIWDVISVTAILVDARGRFLVQHRDDRPDIANPGLWGSFGGEIEPHETPAAGFLRELEEELGWRPKTWAMYGAAPYTPQSGRGSDRPNSNLIYVYAAALDVPYRQLDLREGQGMAVFPIDGLPPTTVAAYKALLERFAREDLYSAMTTAAV
jgi:8-oxo-dGTP pyrophosphatase MutT (NUDIX family)